MIRPVRLAFDVTALHGPRTGIGTFAAEVLRRLPGHEGLDIVAFSLSWRGRHDVDALVPSGVRVTHRPAAAQPLRQLWRRVDWPPVTWWSGPVDVVHGPNYVVPPTRGAVGLSSIHDLTPFHFPEMCTSDVLQYPALLRRQLERGCHVHASSSFVAGEVIDVLGWPAERVHVVPLGVSSVAGGDPARGAQLAGGERYVLAIGTVEPRKDHAGLVDAFDAVAADDPDIRLVIAGPAGWRTEAFTAALARAHARDRIAHLGFVDDATRADLLAGATVFAFPSLYEGFGLPPLEAMAAGTPVVTTTAGSIPEVVADAAVLVSPGDPDALADAIRMVADDDAATREARVAKGRAHAAHYSWDATADGLAALYGALAGGC